MAEIQERHETGQREGDRFPWEKAALLVAAFGALVWCGIKVGMHGHLDVLECLVLPIVLLPGVGYVFVASVRRSGRSRQATSRVWMIPWTAACAGIVSLSLVLLFMSCESFAVFVYGAVVAPAPFFFVLLMETELGFWHSDGWVWTAGLVFFVLEWSAIWSVGMLSLWKRRPIPLTALAAGHCGLGMVILAVLGSIAVATGALG